MHYKTMSSHSKKFLNQLPVGLGATLILSVQILYSRANAQTTPLTSCPLSECRFNQTNGSSNSVAVGMTSSFGVNSSAQASPSYNSSASAALVLNAFDSSNTTQTKHNSSVQSIGLDSNNTTTPINVSINSNTIVTKSKDGATSQEFSDTKQQSTSNNFSDNSTTTSTADFSAQGFGALQDLKFQGGSDTGGSKFTSDVQPIINTDESGKKSTGTNYGTGSSSAGAETRTRLQAEINTSNFVNAFISTF